MLETTTMVARAMGLPAGAGWPAAKPSKVLRPTMKLPVVATCAAKSARASGRGGCCGSLRW